MKRTNVVLDDALLEEAVRVLGAKTYSAAINQALEETIRFHKIRRIPELIGKIHWDGDLSEMREDRPHATETARGGR